MEINNNKKLVEDTYKAFSRGELQYIVDVCADEVSWSYYGFPRLPFVGDFQGKAGVKHFFESLRHTIKTRDYEWNEFVIDGDQAVVLGSGKVEVKSTGKEFEHNWCHVYNLKNGRIVTFRGFTSNPHGMAFAFNVL
ncbi:MAG: nuclear transport factor 2 family protein [Pleurocapsa sp. MO_192.B19]|nr:nuclear transport factor 2 family protein [Pleurocapsa sp. MO_192.B19]